MSLHIIFVLVTGLLFIGCGGDSTDNNSTSVSSSSVSNLGNSMNTWGYYGENVMLGDEPVSGDWTISYGNGYILYRFRDDGTGFRSANIFISIGHEFTFGVDESGMQVTIKRTGTLEPWSYTCTKFENSCCYISDEELLCKEPAE